MRIKKDKTTGLPLLPEGCYFEVYETKGKYNDEVLRIRINNPAEGYCWSQNIDGERDPENITKWDVKRAAKSIYIKFMDDRKEKFVSPFIGTYPPNKI